MRQSSRDVIEVDFRDLFFHLLYRWRSLLAAVLIGALLLGGWTFYNNRKNQPRREEAARVYQEQLNAWQEARDKILADFEASRDAEQSRVDELNKNQQQVVDAYSRLLESNKQYMRDSVLLNSDPFHEWQARAVYAVVPESILAAQSGVAIAAAYPSVIFFDWDASKLAEIYGADKAAYASELFRCAAVQSSETFVVTAVGQTEEMAKAGLEYLNQAVQAFSAGEGQSLGAHTLKKLNEYTLQVVDTGTDSQIRNIANIQAAYQNLVNNAKAALVTPAALELPPEEEAPAAPAEIVDKSVPFYAFVGGAAGLLLLLLVYFVSYVLSGKLQHCQYFRRQGVPVLSEFAHSRARRPGKGIDGWIEKRECRNRKADRAALVGKIGAILENQDRGEILLTGTLPGNAVQALGEELLKNAKKEISVRMEGDILNNPKAVEAANHADTVVVVEEKYVSELRDIRQMMEILDVCKASVLGAVIL